MRFLAKTASAGVGVAVTAGFASAKTAGEDAAAGAVVCVCCGFPVYFVSLLVLVVAIVNRKRDRQLEDHP